MQANMQNNMQRLTDLLEPSIEAMGYELVLIEQTHNKQEAVLRLYIDAPGGILVDDCAQVSRQVSVIMDVEDPIRGAYALEVSSPGSDRPLVKPAHFEVQIGEIVRVQTHDYILGRRRFKGALLEASGKQIVVEVDGEEYEIPFDEIESARLVPDFDV